MLPVFCLRLACGMVASLLLLSPAQVNPRFYRVHFLTGLGLGALALVWGMSTAGSWMLLALGVGLALAFLGSMSWSIEGAPGGRTLIVLTTAALGTALGDLEIGAHPGLRPEWALTNGFSSAALLGTTMSAMLIGHSYLIAPSMSITPLKVLVAASAAAILVRLGVAATALWFWTEGHSLFTLNDVTLFLPLRWVLGFVLPLGLLGMAWETARIRSTQSATGILYVVVIFCFLGELSSLVLLAFSGSNLM